MRSIASCSFFSSGAMPLAPSFMNTGIIDSRLAPAENTSSGDQLTRRHGSTGSRPVVLAPPEVTLHLGSAFLVDMTRRFGALPLVLSAYNAGPSRATRWREFPEALDDLRFTERIPFVETRGYVKNIRRNLGLYRVLYGDD